MSVLDEILGHKRDEVEQAKARIAPALMAENAKTSATPTRGFLRALREAEPPAVIAEIKRRSPSKGEIRPDLEPVECARAYAAGGAAALSVLTDEHYFGGHLDYLAQVREAVALPVLRKDFIVDAYQIDEARVAGADAILLIVSALAPGALGELAAYAQARTLDVLVEVHDEQELELALRVGADLVGVNNRDLRTFEVDLAHSERVAARLETLCAEDPSLDRPLLVAESGIHTPADVARLARVGAGAFLVGESLMRQADPGEALRSLRKTE